MKQKGRLYYLLQSQNLCPKTNTLSNPEINILLILKEEKRVMRERGSMKMMRESLPVFFGGREAWVCMWEEKEKVTVFCLHE